MGNSGYGDSMALLINDLSETLLYLASGTAVGVGARYRTKDDRALCHHFVRPE